MFLKRFLKIIYLIFVLLLLFCVIKSSNGFEDFEDATINPENVDPDCLDYDENLRPRLRSECLPGHSREPTGKLQFFDGEPRNEGIVKELEKHHHHGKKEIFENLKGFFLYIALLLIVAIVFVAFFTVKLIFRIQKFKQIEELTWRIRNEAMFTSELSDEEELVSRV